MFDRPLLTVLFFPPLSSFLLKMSSGPSSEEGKAKAEAKAKAPIPPRYLTKTPERPVRQPVLEKTPLVVKPSSFKTSKDTFHSAKQGRILTADEMSDRFATIGYEGFIELMFEESKPLGAELRDITRADFQNEEILKGPLDKLKAHTFTQTEHYDYPILVSGLSISSGGTQRPPPSALSSTPHFNLPNPPPETNAWSFTIQAIDQTILASRKKEQNPLWKTLSWILGSSPTLESTDLWLIQAG